MPAHRWYAIADGTTDGRRRARPAAVHDRRPGRASSRPRPTPAITIVEGAGGPRSPLAADGDSVRLGRALDADAVVLVAPAGLGTINAVRLSAAALRAGRAAATRLVVALNRFDGDDDLHRRNHGWLAGEGFHLVTDPGRAGRRADALADRVD